MTTTQSRLALVRIHLRSVGPSPARFDPLDLDLSAIDGPADRALLSLTNTGGKSSLIKLVTSVLVPRASEQVGGAHIGEYVATGDVAHIVLEWDHGGQRFITGAVYEWRDRQRPSNPAMSELVREYYTFRATGISIDDLRFDQTTDSGQRRKRTLADYRTQTLELFRNHPQAIFGWAKNQADWSALLDERTRSTPN